MWYRNAISSAANDSWLGQTMGHAQPSTVSEAVAKPMHGSPLPFCPLLACCAMVLFPTHIAFFCYIGTVTQRVVTACSGLSCFVLRGKTYSIVVAVVNLS